MPDYRRAFRPGGTFFFTVVTHNRRPILCQPKAYLFLHTAIETVLNERPFEGLAFVLLPEHFHCIWKLPDGDGDFSTRMACIKKMFTRLWLEDGGDEFAVSKARRKHRERGIWQKRFWEHTIRDENDFIRHVNYIHYNPIKHNLAKCPHAWPYSTFGRWVENGYYKRDWLCYCDNKKPTVLDYLCNGNTFGQ